MDTQFNDELINEVDPTKQYSCSPIIKSTGFTVLMKWCLCYHKNPLIVNKISKYLKTHPEEINKQNTNGWTALMISARNGRFLSSSSIVSLLIKAGADVNLQNNCGWSALMLAAQYSNTDSSEDIVSLLIDAKTNVDLQNKEGVTALIMAIKCLQTNSTKKTAHMLLDAGANVNLYYNNGWTALTVLLEDNLSYDTIDLAKRLLPLSSLYSKNKYNNSVAKIIASLNYDYIFLLLDDQYSTPTQGTCNICFEDDNVIKITCSHIYHKNCLLGWLAKSQNTCPVCRSFIV